MPERGHPDYLPNIRGRLYTAVLSDVLDGLGYRDQAMPPSIRPLDDALVMAGFARTGLYREIHRVVPDENPYELEIALVDDLKPDDIAVFGCGGSTRIAPWGELLTTASRARGAAGCVTDGYVRDIRQIRAEVPGVPRRHRAARLQRPRHGRRDRRPDPLRGVAIAPGDLVVGDADGVIVVPRAVEAEAVAQAFAKVTSEDRTRDELAAGVKLADVFAKYRVL